MVVGSGYRLIETRYPTISVFEDCETEEELRDVIAAKTSVNPRLNGLSETIGLGSIPYGIPGVSYAVAPFIFSDNGARFNPPMVGCLYAAKEIDTAKAEVLYHRALFLSYNNLYKFTSVEYRVLKVDFAISEENWLDVTDVDLSHDIYNLHSYDQSQKFGLEKKNEGIQGIKFNSVRKLNGNNFALFTPSIIKKVTPCELKVLTSESHDEIHWADY